MSPDDADAGVLDEVARVLETESEMVKIELVLRGVLPSLLDGMVAALARAFQVEIVALHNRLDRLEGNR